MLRKIMVSFALCSLILSTGQASFAKHSQKKKNFNVLSYIKDKVCEIPQMRLTHDLRLWQINRSIKKQHKTRSFHYVPLSKLKQLHPVTRTLSMVKVEKRVKAIEDANLINAKKISRKDCDTAMPSITPFQVARFDKQTYYIFEGNGRFVSLKKAFEGLQGADPLIEVEVFDMTGNERILRKIEILRRKNGLAEVVRY